jgi:hypothetical protein
MLQAAAFPISNIQLHGFSQLSVSCCKAAAVFVEKKMK